MVITNLDYISDQQDDVKHHQKQRYGHIPSGHKIHPAYIKVGEPVYVEPNSYVDVAHVLRNIGTECNLSRYCSDGDEDNEQLTCESKEWMLVACDGLPYHLMMNLLYDYVICVHCRKAFTSRDALFQHCKIEHVDLLDRNEVHYCLEFDWVLPKIGSGHYEMNMLKTFFGVNWIPFMKNLCYEMGFQSPIAQASAKKCADTHKAWAMLLIFHQGTLKELVLPYVRQCMREGEVPSTDGFMTYIHNHRTNDTLMMYFEMVLRYSQSIINMRMGVRRNNSRLVQSAKHKFSPLLHARNHPKYQVIDIYDELYRRMAPDAVREFLDAHESLSRSGNPSTGQDMDFLLEEENRKTKQLLPPGIPSNQQWEIVCRNLDDLHVLRNKYLLMIDMKGSINAGNSFDVYIRPTYINTDQTKLESFSTY